MGRVNLSGRVAFFRKYSVQKCFTIEVNFTSSLKSIKLPLKNKFDPTKNSGLNIKVISGFEKLALKQSNEVTILTKGSFQKVGKALLRTIADYFELLQESRVFGSSFMNHDNFKTSVTLDLAMKFPYRFYHNIQTFILNKKGKITRWNRSVYQ